MTGPPTPPPSSATEIEDAARTSIPPPLAQAEAQPDTEAQPTPEAPPVETTAQQSPPEAAPQPAQQTASTRNVPVPQNANGLSHNVIPPESRLPIILTLQTIMRIPHQLQHVPKRALDNRLGIPLDDQT